MYRPNKKPSDNIIKVGQLANVISVTKRQNVLTGKDDALTTFTPLGTCNTVDIHALASAFAALLPEYVFSRAETEGFVLTKKRNQGTTVKEVANLITYCM